MYVTDLRYRQSNPVSNAPLAASAVNAAVAMPVKVEQDQCSHEYLRDLVPHRPSR